MTLYDKLVELNNSDMLPLHMPGHKRKDDITSMADIYSIDITEIDGFDDLHDPCGIIADLQEEAARLYKAEKAWISVNGSSAANEAAILSLCAAGDNIIIPRCSHKSVYHAVETGRLNPIYLPQKHLPGSGAVLPPSASDVEEILEETDVRAVVITSPTYEGAVADIKSIAETVHEYGAFLFVDCAHGAHLGLSDLTVPNPITLGADLCSVSLHKMLPAPTQTALLLASKDFEWYDRADHYMDVFQSSSPSYVLMAGIGECIRYVSEHGAKKLESVTGLMSNLREELSGLKVLDVSVPSCDRGDVTFDPLKLMIRSRMKDVSGHDIYEELRTGYHIQCEMHADRYALGFITMADDSGRIDRVKEALIAIDEKLSKTAHEETAPGPDDITDHIPAMRLTASAAYGCASVREEIDENIISRIAGGYVFMYPPGVPVIVPGEEIDAVVLGIIREGMKNGTKFTGISDGLISVLD